MESKKVKQGDDEEGDHNGEDNGDTDENGVLYWRSSSSDFVTKPGLKLNQKSNEGLPPKTVSFFENVVLLASDYYGFIGHGFLTVNMAPGTFRPLPASVLPTISDEVLSTVSDILPTVSESAKKFPK